MRNQRRATRRRRVVAKRGESVAKKLHEFSGLFKGMLGVADGNPILFDAQITLVSVGELETCWVPKRGICV